MKKRNSKYAGIHSLLLDDGFSDLWSVAITLYWLLYHAIVTHRGFLP